MLAGVAAEILERPFVGIEELGQRLIGTGVVGGLFPRLPETPTEASLP
jgi:hypothetical protein